MSGVESGVLDGARTTLGFRRWWASAVAHLCFEAAAMVIPLGCALLQPEGVGVRCFGGLDSGDGGGSGGLAGGGAGADGEGLCFK